MKLPQIFTKNFGEYLSLREIRIDTWILLDEEKGGEKWL